MMQIVFDDGAEEHELDLVVGNPAASVGDLAGALAPDRVAGAGALLVGDHAVPFDHDLVESGLHEGVVVRLVDGDEPAVAEPTTWELHVTAGTEAGRRLPLQRGPNLVGRAAGAPVRLTSPTVSNEHVIVTLHDDDTVTVRDLGSHNGTWIDEVPAVSPAEVPLAPGAQLRVGAVHLAVRPARVDDRPGGIDPRRHVTVGGVLPFNRSPREALPPEPAAIQVPEAPKAAGAKVPIVGLATFAPLLTAGGMVAMTGNTRYGLFAALSPVAGVFAAVGRRRQGSKTARRDDARFRQELATFASDLGVLADAQRERLAALAPDPGEVVRRAQLPSVRLWERVRGDRLFSDFLLLRVGTGEVPWAPPVGRPRDEHADVTAMLAAASTVERAPVLVDLAGGGVVGIVGERTAAIALARSLVCQAAVHHGPSELPMVVCTTDDHTDDWDFAKWLPHTRDATGSMRLLSGSTQRSTELLEALVRSRTAGEASRRPGRPDDDDRQTVLVVLDDESLTEGRRSPARTLLRGAAGPVAGIVVAERADRLPAMVTTVVTLLDEDGSATLERPQQGERVDALLAAGLDDATARCCARSLARFEDPELEIAGAGLPDRVRLLPLLELDEPTASAIAARWSSRPSHAAPASPIGVTEDGVFTIDLVRDGPHGLVAGTTGAGKSELLRTLVIGLAASVDPDHLTFVLVDFKGGSAFDRCSRLPHTVGMVTDLDPHLAERALRCLEAELRFREGLLRDAGTADLPEYLLAGAPLGPLPRLFVIIDEFATLKAELPDFVDSLVGVAQRGRSLGVHLLLATQRPTGAVSENIKANTNLRIALRVQDTGDSNDVIGVGDAASIPRGRAGRAYVRLGPGEVVPIQTARSTATDAVGEVAAVDIAPFRFGPLPRPPAERPEVGADAADAARSDLAVLVELAQEAFERSGRPLPRRPWPEPLPLSVALEELEVVDDEVVLALADDPDGQRQHPIGWRMGDGNLLIYGIVGSGTTTTAATLALSLARTRSPDALHLYVFDMGAGELAPLARLPHCGAVVGAVEKERQLRLVRLLRAELDRRRQLDPVARAGEPAIVTILDGWATFVADHKDIAGQALLDDFVRVIADGPEVGLWSVVTADRVGAIPSQVASLVRQRLLLRLGDPSDYGMAGIAARNVPSMPPGRAFVAETGQLVHVASVEDLAAAVDAVRGAVGPVGRPPASIEVLPAEVAFGEIRGASRLDARPWFVAIGRRERDLAPGGLHAYAGEHALVGGGARTGKTSALALIAAAVRAADPATTVVAVSGPRSQLPSLIDANVAVRPEQLAEALDAVDSAAGRVLLLVDDAEGVDDVGDRLGKLVGGGPAPPDLLVVAAGRPDVLRGMYNHWTRTLRRSKLGVLLQPNPELDGEVFGVQLPRRPPVAMVVGRGYAVNGGELEIVHLATPPALDPV